jgi:hypothetical protein
LLRHGEDTLDWFAQDVDGNVWYFGESTQQLADGLVIGLENKFYAPDVGNVLTIDVNTGERSDLIEIRTGG